MGVVTGFQISHALQVGYSYEFAANQIAELNFNTHEFRVALRLGKEKTPLSKSAKPKVLPTGLKMHH
jgi:hypothetical protein